MINVRYDATGQSQTVNPMGMREMQSRAYEHRDAQYLLLKAPPACGKSRALMFVALAKLHEQGLRKAIVAVPEQSIGKSFAATDLRTAGFPWDWAPNPRYNLCTPYGDDRKVALFQEFMASQESILICTHATLRFAFDAVDTQAFNQCLVAIDEFHHVSASQESKLGNLLRVLMDQSTAHVVAMTGSYFRGDGAPVLMPEDEARFKRVTYTYYEQLNGYRFLKSLGIGYHFYQGKYLSGLPDVLDTDLKTIIHIPSVQSGESTKDKYDEVNQIMDLIGEVDHQDEETGLFHIRRRSDGRIIKVADLVNDNLHERAKVIDFLRRVSSVDDLDIIIALGMAKEGFDWSFCEHSLTIGYRGSLTEIVQIIGRCTRDSSNKNHARFTNLIAQPDVADDEVTVAVNNMLKAITCSLLMEQVLAPQFKFRAKVPEEESESNVVPGGTITITGFKEPTSQRVQAIVDEDLDELKAAILQDDRIANAVSGGVHAEVINRVLIPKIIERRYPDLSPEEAESLRHYVVADTALKAAEIETQTGDGGDRRFIRLANRFININELDIDLIDSINPFQKAFEVLSKSVDTKTLGAIRNAIAESRIRMTEEEALLLWPKANAFYRNHGRAPDIDSNDEEEQRLAMAVAFLRRQARERKITPDG